MTNDIYWDDNEFPLAYLITIRTYGTWLHGDERYSMDLHGKNIYGSPEITPNENLVRLMLENRKNDAFALNGRQRGVVDTAIRNVCRLRGYGLAAINVRTNHVHCVISASKKPESIIVALKSNVTRELKEAALISNDQVVWSRGGSRRSYGNRIMWSVQWTMLLTVKEMTYPCFDTVASIKTDTLPTGRVSAFVCTR